jgi:hypothetical protein
MEIRQNLSQVGREWLRIKFMYLVSTSLNNYLLSSITRLGTCSYHYRIYFLFDMLIMTKILQT